MSRWHVHLYTRMALNPAGDWSLVELEDWVSGPLPAQHLGCCTAQSAGGTQVVIAPQGAEKLGLQRGLGGRSCKALQSS